ncbi:MAG: helix-turn-helix transcriptional regulator, partial [Treponema sp.]|nr:helix-turn-helix transcriptional regulator [Treponema sp.]
EVSNTYIANIECGQTWISDKTLEKIANALHLEEYLLFIPETEISSNTIDDRQKMIEYLKSREKEIGDYVKEFFSATFDKILEDK